MLEVNGRLIKKSYFRGACVYYIYGEVAKEAGAGDVAVAAECSPSIHKALGSSLRSTQTGHSVTWPGILAHGSRGMEIKNSSSFSTTWCYIHKDRLR